MRHLIKDLTRNRRAMIPAYSWTEYSIPIKKEEPVITKKSFVREEVIIKKKPITETKTDSWRNKRRSQV